jgi:outer membrane biosynthesis protein TonB
MNHWKVQGEPQGGVSSAVSLAIHALVIALAIVETMPASELDAGSELNRVQYLPPPNPVRVAPMPEQLHYVELPAPAAAAGFRFTAFEPAKAGASSASERNAPPEMVMAAATAAASDSADLAAAAREDSAFTETEVDVPAARVANSAAPAYPAELLKNRVEGMVIARYVVDTTGLADSTSLVIMLATHQEFADAVRRALPGMRFSTARIGEQTVRQLVEQPFAFHIKRP